MQADQLQDRSVTDITGRTVDGGATAIGPHAENILLPEENAVNINSFGTSVEFLDWWDEFWVDGAIPEAVL